MNDTELREQLRKYYLVAKLQRNLEDFILEEEAWLDQVVQLIATHSASVERDARLDELDRAYPHLQKHSGLYGSGSYYYDDRKSELTNQEVEDE